MGAQHSAPRDNRRPAGRAPVRSVAPVRPRAPAELPDAIGNEGMCGRMFRDDGLRDDDSTADEQFDDPGFQRSVLRNNRLRAGADGARGAQCGLIGAQPSLAGRLSLVDLGSQVGDRGLRMIPAAVQPGNHMRPLRMREQMNGMSQLNDRMLRNSAPVQASSHMSPLRMREQMGSMSQLNDRLIMLRPSGGN